MAFTFYGKSIINDYLIMFINIPYISLNYNSTSNYTSGLKFYFIDASHAKLKALKQLILFLMKKKYEKLKIH
jgi:hypothetical protein